MLTRRMNQDDINNSDFEVIAAMAGGFNVPEMYLPNDTLFESASIECLDIIYNMVNSNE